MTAVPLDGAITARMRSPAGHARRHRVGRPRAVCFGSRATLPFVLLCLVATSSAAQQGPPQPGNSGRVERKTSGASAARRGTAFPRSALLELDRLLALGNSDAASAVLRELEPQFASDERLAFDTIYVFLGHRRFAEGRDIWNRLATSLQENLKSARAATLAPAAEAALKQQVAEALFVQGLLAARTGSKEEALRLLRQADGYGFPPLDSPLMLLAADCLHDLQEDDLAAQAYREMLQRAPGNTRARLGLGVALFSSGDLVGAEREITRVVAGDSATPMANYWLGAVLLEQKRPDEAKTALELELDRQPHCTDCLAKLAQVAYLAGEDRECETWLSQAMALDSKQVEANLVSGMLANRTGRYDLAIRHLSLVVAQAPDSVRARYQLAFAYRRSGDPQKALEHSEIYERLIQAEKNRSLGVRGDPK